MVNKRFILKAKNYAIKQLINLPRKSRYSLDILAKMWVAANFKPKFSKKILLKLQVKSQCSHQQNKYTLQGYFMLTKKRDFQ